MQRTVRRLLAAVMAVGLLGTPIVLGAATPAGAVDSQPGDTTGGATYNRVTSTAASVNNCSQPSVLSGTNATRYQVHPIHVTAPEVLEANVVHGTHPDAFLSVYCTFDPANPQAGLLFADDDTNGLQPAVTPADNVVLQPGTTYFLVVSGFGNAQFGTYTLNLTSATARFGPAPAVITLFSDDFEAGLGNWTATGLWNLEDQTDTCGSQVAPFPSPTKAAWYGSEAAACTFNVGTTAGDLTLNTPVAVPPQGGELRFDTWYEDENWPGAFDRKLVQVSTNDGGTWQTERELDGPQQEWQTIVVPLDAYAGETIRLRFRFDSGDPIANSFLGWFVDNVLIQPRPAATGATVSVSAPTNVAVEGGAPGQLRFTRTGGDSSQNLQVGYQLSGDAVAGQDYEPIGPVVIPAGQTSVTVPVQAIDDGVQEPDRLLRVTVTPGDNYTLGASQSADITITDPPPPPADPCEGLGASGFTDISDSVHRETIECLAGLDITQGGPGGLPATQYGPRQPTTRAQMASFVARTLEAGGITLPANPPDAFTDDDDSVHELRINQLAAVGVIGDNGEEGTSYRPSDVITRGEMASFVNGIVEQFASERLTTEEDFFTDDDGTDYEADINALASVGIVEGIGGGLYDPDGDVRRDSMASFLVRTIRYLAEQRAFPAA